MNTTENDFPGSNASYNVNGSDDGDDGQDSPGFFSTLKIKADDFRHYLSTTFCACIASIPSFALVILAVVLIMLLIATIPLAFALTYMNPQPSIDAEAPIIQDIPTFREHNRWPSDDDQTFDTFEIVKSTALLPQNITGCKGFGFACTNDPSVVIGTNQRCDGVKDCIDGSDESDCHKCQTSFSCAARKGHPNQLKCLRGNRLCDGSQECDDNSDESDDLCRPSNMCDVDEYKCKNSGRCIHKSMVCDGDNHCPDGDDEQSCSACKNGSKHCEPLNKCIPKWKLCDGVADCPDSSDEKDCDCTSCSGMDKALCNATKTPMCLKKSRICDGVKDCPDGEDEKQCPGSCEINPAEEKMSIHTTNDDSPTMKLIAANERKEVHCSDGKDYKWRVACGGLISRCDGACKECNPETAFTCKTNSAGGLKHCVHRSKVCDGFKDCEDGSDEADCKCDAPGKTPCNSTSGGSHCYSESQRCDGFRDCSSGEDEMGCEKCSKIGFWCAKDKKCLRSSQRCDGVADCSDSSDELNCTCRECKNQPFKMYMCSSGDRCFRMSDVCNPTSQCPDATDLDKLFCATRAGNISYF